MKYDIRQGFISPMIRMIRNLDSELADDLQDEFDLRLTGDSERMVDRGAALSLVYRASVDLEVPDLAALGYEHADESDTGVFGRRLAHCLTLHHMLERCFEAIPKAAPGSRLWLAWGTKESWICRATSDEFLARTEATHGVPREEVNRQGELGAIIFAISMLRSVEPAFVPDRVQIEVHHHERSGIEGLLDNVEMRGGTPFTCVPFPTEFLYRPLPIGPLPPHLHGLRRLVTEHPGTTDTVEDVAEKLDLRARSLQRELAREGTSYTRLLERARMDQAIELMRTSKPMAEIAATVGYAHLPGFSRAFKHWTGLSPTQWREREDGHAQPPAQHG